MKSSTEIHNAFEALSKDQLTRLRKMADYPIKSNLNKAALVDALVDNFRKDPVRLLMKLPVYDLQYLSKMCSIDRDTAIYDEIFPDMLYIQEFNICEWEISDDGSQQKMWLTDDVYMLISPFVDQILSDVTESGRYTIDYFFWGMLWLYGFPPAEMFLKIIKKEFGEDEKEWWPVFRMLCGYYPFVDYNTNHMIIHPAIGDLEYQFSQRDERGFDKNPMKEYTMQEIVEIGATGPYFHYPFCKKEFNAAIKALKKIGFDEDDAEAKLSNLWFDVQEVEGPVRPTEIFKRAIGGDTDLNSVEELDLLAEALFSYMNNIPRWIFGGRTPSEISDNPADRERFAMMDAALDRMAASYAGHPVVGRNDPCPCGSGLKYKNCHGKNFS